MTAAAAARPGKVQPGRILELGDERSLHVVEMGEGRPIVLIHGAMVDGEDWLVGPAEPLSELGRLLVVDRPGHGLSRRPRFDGSPHAQAAQIREGIRQLGVERPILVGHSFGGMVALAYAADFPDEVAGLALLAPLAFPELRPLEHLYFSPRSAPVGGPILARAARYTTDPLFWGVTRQLMFSPQEPPARWMQTYTADRVTNVAKMVSEGEDAGYILPGVPGGLVAYDRITAPTLIVHGDKDKVADPSRHARPLAERLGGAERRELQGVGHMVHHAATAEVVAAVADLITRTPRAAA